MVLTNPYNGPFGITYVYVPRSYLSYGRFASAYSKDSKGNFKIKKESGSNNAFWRYHIVLKKLSRTTTQKGTKPKRIITFQVAQEKVFYVSLVKIIQHKNIYYLPK